MKLKKIYVVIREGLDNEVSIIKAFDTEKAAEEAVGILGYCEIYSHQYVETFLQEE